MKNTIYLAIFILLASGCSLIFEEDLSQESVVMLLPTDSTETVIQELLFWWETLPGAEEYKLQIVVGDFASPTDLILDVTIAEDKYEINLSPNVYQWRIKAMNQYSETGYTIGDVCIIDTTTSR